MRILFFPRYGRRGASSRYRLWQYVPLFRQLGHEVMVEPLLEDGYLQQLYEERRRGPSWMFRGYTRRIRTMRKARDFDAVICEQEFLPHFPAAAGWLPAAARERLILDYDDAAYYKYARLLWLRNKIPLLMKTVQAVVVGNRYLEAYAKRYTDRVFLIPTVVNPDLYPGSGNAGGDGALRIAWIGTPLTASFLRPLAAVFQRLQAAFPNLVLRLIGAGTDSPIPGVRTELMEWSEDTEGKLLAECDIGIMPLNDNEFTRAKCGLKLIQYMASGLPVVASPVGANCDIVAEGVDGFLADNCAQWEEKLSLLLQSQNLRRQFGAAGRTKVVQRYSLAAGFAQWCRVMEGLHPGFAGAAGPELPWAYRNPELKIKEVQA